MNTVRELIAKTITGNSKASDERIMQESEGANAHEIISKIKNAVETPSDFLMLQVFTEVAKIFNQHKYTYPSHFRILELARQEALYYHNIQYEKENSNRNSQLPEKG